MRKRGENSRKEKLSQLIRDAWKEAPRKGKIIIIIELTVSALMLIAAAIILIH